MSVAVEYAANLEVLNAGSGAPAALSDVVAVISDWAEIPVDGPVAFEGSGRNGGRVVATALDVDDADAWGWRLTIDVSAPDRGGDLVSWIATVVAVESTRTDVSIRIERVVQAAILRPAEQRPRPPRVVAALVDASTLSVVDGALPVRTVPMTLRPERLDAFVRSLVEPAMRRLPIVGVSEALGTCAVSLDVRQLAEDLAGIAHVVVIPDDVSRELSNRLGHRLGVYNGATRLWWPGLMLTDDPRRHPFWTRNSASRARAEIVELVAGVAASRLGEPPIVRDLEVRVQARAAEAARAELDQLLERVTAPAVADADRDTLVATIRERLALVQADRDEALELAARLDREHDDLQRELAGLRGEVFHLRAALNGRSDAPDANGEGLFLEQVRESYERRLANGDRDAPPLRQITLGASFLAMLEQVDVPRQKVIDVCAEVACGIASKVNGRKVHQLRASDAGDAPPRRRHLDGAVAWRCALEQGTQAARLHWWAVNGTVEFASVGPHEFMDIPE